MMKETKEKTNTILTDEKMTFSQLQESLEMMDLKLDNWDLAYGISTIVKKYVMNLREKENLRKAIEQAENDEWLKVSYESSFWRYRELVCECSDILIALVGGDNFTPCTNRTDCNNDTFTLYGTVYNIYDFDVSSI